VASERALSVSLLHLRRLEQDGEERPRRDPWGGTPLPGVPSVVVTYRRGRTSSATTAVCLPPTGWSPRSGRAKQGAGHKNLLALGAVVQARRWVRGRNMFDPVGGYPWGRRTVDGLAGRRPALPLPCVHRHPSPASSRGDGRRTTFHFVTDGIEPVLQSVLRADPVKRLERVVTATEIDGFDEIVCSPAASSTRRSKAVLAIIGWPVRACGD